jgi:hypothetical protein
MSCREGCARGGYFCYLAVHPMSGRKKDTFMGIAADPIKDLFARNHALPLVESVPPSPAPAGAARAPSASDTSERGQRRRRKRSSENGKETHLAAPYWSFAAVIGPTSRDHAGAALTLDQCVALRAKWMSGTRGEKSKMARAQRLARELGMVYYGRDVAVDDAHVLDVVVTTSGAMAASELGKVREAAAIARARGPVWPRGQLAVFEAAALLGAWLPELLCKQDACRVADVRRLDGLFRSGVAALSFALR